MFDFVKKHTEENISKSIKHNYDEIAVLSATLKFMISYPDAYVNKYDFHFEKVYTQKKMNIIKSLYQKYEQSVLTQGFNFIYSDEELFVLWTIINIMTQVPEGEKSQDIYVHLLGALSHATVLAEKNYS